MRRGDSFSLAREKITNYDVFHHYFDLLGETLTKYDLKDKPSQIYNCDESGMPLEHKLPRVVAIKGTNKTLGRAQDPRANGAWLNKLTE